MICQWFLIATEPPVIAERVYNGNAALIAAAPDLYAALEQLLSINPLSDYNETRDAKIIARAALAAARGE